MTATQTPPTTQRRMLLPADILTIAVLGYQAMVSSLGGGLYTPGTEDDELLKRPILHALTVVWSDHSASGRPAYIGWDAEVHELMAIKIRAQQ